MTGIAGIGKSRLGWEFFKYMDGLAGRRLVAPRPLPRLRGGRRVLGARRDGPHALPASSKARSLDSAAAKLASSAREVSSPTRRNAPSSSRGIAPSPRARGRSPPEVRTSSSAPGDSSSSAWPTRDPSCSSFEDLQWADAALVEFVEPPARVVAEPPDLRARVSPGRSSRAVTRSSGTARIRRTSRSLRSPNRR